MLIHLPTRQEAQTMSSVDLQVAARIVFVPWRGQVVWEQHLRGKSPSPISVAPDSTVNGWEGRIKNNKNERKRFRICCTKNFGDTIFTASEHYTNCTLYWWLEQHLIYQNYLLTTAFCGWVLSLLPLHALARTQCWVKIFFLLIKERINQAYIYIYTISTYIVSDRITNVRNKYVMNLIGH